jgi:hypothetical protein
MSTAKLLPRLTAAAVAATGAVFAALSIASPAYAADPVQTDISSLSSQITAGSRADGFRVTMENQTNTEINTIRRSFVIKLPGLTANNVRIILEGRQLQLSGSTGELRASDTLPIRLGPRGKAGSKVTDTYSIQFGATTPNGRVDLTFQALVNNTLLGSSTQTITVRGGATAAPTKTPSRTPTAAATEETAVNPGGDTGAVNTFKPLEEPTTATTPVSNTGVPVVLYVMGAGLLGVGGAILWLLFRRRPDLAGVADDYPTGAYASVPPPTLGYPAGPPGPAAPPPAPPAPQGPPTSLRRRPTVITPQATKVMPNVRDSMPPPADPWAPRHGSND